MKFNSSYGSCVTVKSKELIKAVYDITGNLFEDNSALIGGAIYIDSIYQLNLMYNTFLKNKAS